MKKIWATNRQIGFEVFVVVVFFLAVSLTLALIEAVLCVWMEEFIKFKEAFPKSRGIERCPCATGAPQHWEDVIGPKLSIRHVDLG